MTGRDLRVLIVVASKHGATAEIGTALARGLADSAVGPATGLEAVCLPVEQRPDPAHYDAVVLGSAVYMGRWLEPAREYAAAHAAALRGRPVWLFSSGPIGEPPFPADEPHDVGALSQLTGALRHRVFPGRLEKKGLSFGESRGDRNACAGGRLPRLGRRPGMGRRGRRGRGPPGHLDGRPGLLAGGPPVICVTQRRRGPPTRPGQR